MSIVLQSSGGGSVTIAEPATASNFTATLPAVTGDIVVSGTTPSLNGITFPSTQVPSADANTLDDYEEGTWTVTDQSGAGVSFTTNSATYIKIGQMVWAQAYFAIPATANTSNMTINLPFAVANYYTEGAARSNSTALLAAPMTIEPQASNSVATMYQGRVQLINSNFSSSFIVLGVVYRTTA
jgi:hypothetical protein